MCVIRYINNGLRAIVFVESALNSYLCDYINIE